MPINADWSCLIIVGAYSFKLELSEMTAATSVELWLSTDSNPLNISLILSLLYDNMVSTPGISERYAQL